MILWQVETQVSDFETKCNSFEKLELRNNLEISGVSDSISGSRLESKAVKVFNTIGLIDLEDKTEMCHCTGKSKVTQSLRPCE